MESLDIIFKLVMMVEGAWLCLSVTTMLGLRLWEAKKLQDSLRKGPLSNLFGGNGELPVMFAAPRGPGGPMPPTPPGVTPEASPGQYA